MVKQFKYMLAAFLAGLMANLDSLFLVLGLCFPVYAAFTVNRFWGFLALGAALIILASIIDHTRTELRKGGDN